MMNASGADPIEILLVEDSLGYVHMTQWALRNCKVANHISVARTGEEALAFLRREGAYDRAPCPGIILLDLNLPGMDGRELLLEIKQDQRLKRIPVIILTTSSVDEDIIKAYDLHANCYIVKPVTLDQFNRVFKAIEGFWFKVVKLPN